MQNAQEQKERIFSLIRAAGPSLPVRIASETKLAPLFASAFLSELYGERRIKISGLRVGSSPLYYIPGQEDMLENFIQHLNQRERDAFLILKEKKVLEDNKLEPVVRVALRAIPDFAIPLRIKTNNDSKMFWRYHLLSEADAIKMITSHKTPVEEKKAEPQTVKEKPKEKLVEIKYIKEAKEAKENQEIKETKEAKKTNESEGISISSAARSYIERKGLVLIAIVSEKKREFHAKVHSSSMFGPQQYYLLAKDKKKFSQTDVKSLIDVAQKEKMPGILLCQGEADKKAQVLLNEWVNLVKFEKISL